MYLTTKEATSDQRRYTPRRTSRTKSLDQLLPAIYLAMVIRLICSRDVALTRSRGIAAALTRHARFERKESSLTIIAIITMIIIVMAKMDL